MYSACVPSRLHREGKKQLRQSAMMFRGAANHHQPILPQLLHSMRQEISDDMGSRQSRCQQHSLVPTSKPARGSDPVAAGQSRPHLHLISTQFRDTSPQSPSLLDPVLYWIQHTLLQATTFFGKDDHKSHPNKSICTAELKLSRSHWSGTSPDQGYFTAALLPCPALPLARPPPCAVAALKPGHS